MSRPAALDNDQLCARLDHLVSSERQGLVEFLRHLGELEQRNLHLALGYDCLFSYCTKRLRLPKTCAWRRIRAARLLLLFPAIGRYLASGDLCLGGVCLLREVLTPESCADVLERAAGKSEEEVQVLVATIAPQAVPPDSLRRLPRPRGKGAVGSAAEPGAAAGSAAESRKRATIVAVTENQRILRMTVGEAFVQELDEVKRALGHQVPSGRMEAVFRECFRITLEHCRKRKRGADRPEAARAANPPAVARAPGPPKKVESTPQEEPRPAPARDGTAVRRGSKRHIPVAVRREVWARDEGSCGFVGSGGRRCGSQHQLEYHHRRPFVRGGEATAENIALRCRQHNQYEAILDFGFEHIADARRRQSKEPSL
jgi:5-methylcytosine-specific restriction endonuclease McrA